jgi:hypothetical protein
MSVGIPPSERCSFDTCSGRCFSLFANDWADPLVIHVEATGDLSKRQTGRHRVHDRRHLLAPIFRGRDA